MRTWHTTLAAGLVVAILAVAASAQAQQFTLGTPFHTLHDSFFENNSINWAGNYRGITFSYGGGVLARPQFGSPDLSAGLTANFAIVGKYGQINFNTNFSQGSNQSLVTQTPSITLMNGQTGYVSDTSQTPFVVGVIPVVGSFPFAPQQLPPVSGIDPSGFDPRFQAMMQAHADAQAQGADQPQARIGKPNQPQPPQPNNEAPRQDQRRTNTAAIPAPPTPAEAAAERLNAAQESTAGRPALSVAEAKRLHQQEQTAADGEMEALMVRALALEEDGQPNVAKIYYQRIVKHASGELQRRAQARLSELQGSGKR